MEPDAARRWIGSTSRFGIKLGLERMRELMARLGDPQDGIKFIHLAGTNGKGSTSAFLESILRKAGIRTGLYTSPHLEVMNERIRVDGEMISEIDFGRIAGEVKEASEDLELTEFEILTAMAFMMFREAGCEAVVLEVGLGGRFDATNIIGTPELAVITTISLDHTDRLGGTIAAITTEKAGIIKPGCDVLTYPQEPEADAVLERVCSEQAAVLRRLDPGLIADVKREAGGRQIFRYRDLPKLTINIPGRHQIINASLAAEAALTLASKGMNISGANIAAGLDEARWPGRFEILGQAPAVVIDGAHNPQGAAALAAALDDIFTGRKVTLIFGMMDNRDTMDVLRPLLPAARRIITVTTRSTNARTAEELARAIRPVFPDTEAAASPEDALAKALDGSGRDDVICAFGSLYYIGEIRGLMKKLHN